MKVSDFASKMNFKVFSMGDPDREINGAYCGDLLSWVMGNAEENNIWITIMSNINVAAVAEMTDISCIILCESVVPDKNLEEKAKADGLNLFSTDLSAYECACNAKIFI